jgi:hypothetical protein
MTTNKAVEILNEKTEVGEEAIVILKECFHQTMEEMFPQTEAEQESVAAEESSEGMDTYSSMNDQYGGVYELGAILDVETVTEGIKDRDLEGNQLVLSFKDEDKIVIEIFEHIWEDGNPVDYNNLIEFSLSEKDRTDFAAYLRRVADMLERKK